MLPDGEFSARLSVAVPPANAEADERARDVVCPSETDVESRRPETIRAARLDRWPRDFITGYFLCRCVLMR